VGAVAIPVTIQGAVGIHACRGIPPSRHGNRN
jgi:hypothetical protein